MDTGQSKGERRTVIGPVESGVLPQTILKLNSDSVERAGANTQFAGNTFVFVEFHLHLIPVYGDSPGTADS